MQTYLKFLDYIIQNGQEVPDRTGTGTISIFSYEMKFDLRESFPCLTTKKIHMKSVIHELLWFIQGSTNIHYLNQHGVNIWNEWADEAGELGPVYGRQWRAWPSDNGETIDQLSNLIKNLKSNPHSRRHIINAWNVACIDKMALPPCHTMFQFYVNAKKELSCKLTQRSADAFLGVPFNIASYALLTRMIAQVAGFKSGDFIWSGGDCHIYKNHIEQVKLQLSREPYSPPQLWLDPSVRSIDDFSFEHIKLTDYTSHPSIKAPIAV